MSIKKTLSTLVILLLVLLTACNPAGTEPETTPEPGSETPVDESAVATNAAMAFLTGQLGFSEGEIQVVSTEATEFSDSCLGLGGPAESCLQAITPGWVIMLSAGGEEYELRTDAVGQQVRMVGGLESGVGPADVPSAAVQEFLVSELGVALGDVQVIQADPMEFSDSCLGLGGPEELCAQVITPGWIVVVDVQGETYVAHTDELGQQVRLAGDAATGDGADGAADAPSAAVQEFLVDELGVGLGDVQVVSAEQTEFRDGCLGLGGPEESCIQAITPGWIVTVDVQGQTYVAHTDELGQQVRLVP